MPTLAAASSRVTGLRARRMKVNICRREPSPSALTESIAASPEEIGGVMSEVTPSR
jgi:hypothetical protein